MSINDVIIQSIVNFNQSGTRNVHFSRRFTRITPLKQNVCALAVNFSIGDENWLYAQNLLFLSLDDYFQNITFVWRKICSACRTYMETWTLDLKVRSAVLLLTLLSDWHFFLFCLLKFKIRRIRQSVVFRWCNCKVLFTNKLWVTFVAKLYEQGIVL